MPPVVQSLEQILAELETAYAPTRQIYTQQQALIPQKYETVRSGLEGTKNKQFDRIATQANRAGMGFTGFTASEQGDFLADKFLPGMQDTYRQQEEEGLGIAKSLAQLEQDRLLNGMSRRGEQEKLYSTFQENERDRAFRTRESALDRAASAANSAAGRATPTMSKGEIRQGAISFLEAGKGRDGKVSPERFLQAKALWTDVGGDPNEFNTAFRNYVNNAHAKDYGFAAPAKKSAPPKKPAPNYGKLKNKVSY